MRVGELRDALFAAGSNSDVLVFVKRPGALEPHVVTSHTGLHVHEVHRRHDVQAASQLIGK